MPMGTEISLVLEPATVGPPAVRWWKLDAVKGNLPMWVQEELKRADKTEFRHRSDRAAAVSKVSTSPSTANVY
jgi:hypothetical protein